MAVAGTMTDEIRALQDALYVVGGKWKLPIINAICNGHKRFREIERSIPGITTRMLSKELKELEMNQLITRTVYPDAPVLVEYAATDYCKTFGAIVFELIKWGKAHQTIVSGKKANDEKARKSLCDPGPVAS